MVEQVIKYSDGTETVIKYRGVIVDGVLISEKVETSMSEENPEVQETPATPSEPETASEVAAPTAEESADGKEGE